jgi:hypothetical protein
MASAMRKGTERSVLQNFFKNVQQGLKIQVPITPEFTVIVSGHVKTKPYLNRFKLKPRCAPVMRVNRPWNTQFMYAT